MSRRKVVTLPGVSHKAPIPAGAVVGGLLFSSAINGKDPETGTYPDDVSAQAANAFRNMETLVTLAGGTTDDIAHVTVFLRDRDAKAQVDEQWLAMFPDPENRPARHAVGMDRDGAGGALLQLEIIAVVGEDAE